MATCLGSECLEKESYLHLHIIPKVSKKKDLGNLSKDIVIVRNDILEILIGLFVLQEEFIQKLIFVFDLYFNNPNLYFIILWEQDFLLIQSDYIKQLAKNIEYLRKSKKKEIINREFT